MEPEQAQPPPPKYPRIEIRHRWRTDEVLYATETCLDLRAAVEEAVKKRANLVGANLGGAYLVGANLGGANLGGAYLGGAGINWSSHALIAELLLRASGSESTVETIGRRKVAGLILVSRDWCWHDFLKLRKSRHFAWAIDTLAAHVTGGDDAPQILRDRAAELAAAKAKSETVPTP